MIGRTNVFGGGSRINGVIEEYVVANGENINAGDFVRYINKEIGNPISDDTGYVNRYNYSSSQITSAITLSNDKVFIVYLQSQSLYGIIAIIDGNEISLGDPIQLDSDTYSFNMYNLARINDFGVMISFGRTSNYYPFYMVCSIDGLNITKEYQQALFYASNTYTYSQIYNIGENEIAYVSCTKDKSNMMLTVFNFNEDLTIESSPSTIINQSINKYYSLAILEDDNFVITFNNGTFIFIEFLNKTINITKTLSYSLSGTVILTTGIDKNRIALFINSYLYLAVFEENSITLTQSLYFNEKVLQLEKFNDTEISVLYTSSLSNSYYARTICIEFAEIQDTTFIRKNIITFRNSEYQYYGIYANITKYNKNGFLLTYYTAQELTSSSYYYNWNSKCYKRTGLYKVNSKYTSSTGVSKEEKTSGDTIKVITPDI